MRAESLPKSHQKKPDDDFFEILNATNENEKWPLIREWMEDTPHHFFKEMREKSPILVTPECTLLSLYDDVTEALNHPSIFTVELYKPKMGDFLMTEDDTELHHRDRNIMLSLLKKEDLPTIRNFVANKCHSILDIWIRWNQPQNLIEVVSSQSI